MLGLQRCVGNAAVARYVENLEAARIGPAPPRDVIHDSRDLRLRPDHAERPRMAPGTEVPGIVVCYGEQVDALIDTAHHWIEMGDESYGWWPSEPVAQSVILGGVPGVLNGTTLSEWDGTATTDPHHGDPARRHAVVVSTGSYPADPVAATATAAARIRAFANGYSGAYTWSAFGTDCHEFVAEALDAAGLAPSSRRLPALPRPGDR